MAGYAHRRQAPEALPSLVEFKARFVSTFPDHREPLPPRDTFADAEDYAEALADWETEYWFTPRTAYGLATAADVFLDDHLAALREVAPGHWVEDNVCRNPSVVDVGRLETSLVLDYRQAVRDLRDALLAGRYPLPMCTFEEMALHSIIRTAEELEEEGYLRETLDDEQGPHVPETPYDYDWEACRSGLFEDHDVLRLNDQGMDGLNPYDEGDPRMGVARLGRHEWSEWFREPRYDRAANPPFDDVTPMMCTNEEECAVCEHKEDVLRDSGLDYNRLYFADDDSTWLRVTGTAVPLIEEVCASYTPDEFPALLAVVARHYPEAATLHGRLTGARSLGLDYLDRAIHREHQDGVTWEAIAAIVGEDAEHLARRMDGFAERTAAADAAAAEAAEAAAAAEYDE